MDLNIPTTRQDWMRERLFEGETLLAQDVAEALEVSIDTIRRDMIALEDAGDARRVRGGLMPVHAPAHDIFDRLESPDASALKIAERALEHTQTASTLLVDGGRCALELARKLTARDDFVVITPSPLVAMACLERGVDVHMIGGRLSRKGVVNTGEAAINSSEIITADIALLGACGFDEAFGLSADDFDEAQLKFHLAKRARTTIALVRDKNFGKCSRFQAMASDQIDLVITTAKPSTDIRSVKVDYV